MSGLQEWKEGGPLVYLSLRSSPVHGAVESGGKKVFILQLKYLPPMRSLPWPNPSLTLPLPLAPPSLQVDCKLLRTAWFLTETQVGQALDSVD